MFSRGFPVGISKKFAPGKDTQKGENQLEGPGEDG